MSSIDKISDSVDNGLKIAEFIQENRDTIQATYGRSSIEQPSTSDRTKAWELFISKKNSPNSGLQRESNSQNGNTKAESSVFDVDSGEGEIQLSDPYSQVSETYDSGDNNLWDVKDSLEPDDNWTDVYISDSTSTDRGRNINTSRIDESEESNKNNDSNTGSSRDHVREGARPKNDNRTQQSDGGRRPTIKETTEEDLESIMEETLPQPKRRLKNTVTIKEIIEEIPNDPLPVKKTTEKNTQSTVLGDELLSKAGATQSVHQSQRNPEGLTVSVETAQKSATNARDDHEDTTREIMIHRNTQEIIAESRELHIKLDTVIQNQEKLFKKIDSLLELKEEISGIKKTLTNQSISLSTIEGYITELMIAIPRSGQPESTGDEQDNINPDLRMVIGRDHSRARKEVIKRYTDEDKIEISEDMYKIPEIDEKYLSQGVDFTKNNAAKFVPTNSKISYRIIKDMIINDAPNDEIKEELLELVTTSQGEVPVEEMFRSIKQVLYENDF